MTSYHIGGVMVVYNFTDIFNLIVNTIWNDKMKILNAAVCCLVCMSLPHIWLCLPWHFPCVFLRPVGRSPQRPATALSQARLQWFSQNSHNTKCCTGMLLSPPHPHFFLVCFPWLHPLSPSLSQFYWWCYNLKHLRIPSQTEQASLFFFYHGYITNKLTLNFWLWF